MIVCDWLLEVFDCPVVPLFQFEHVLHSPNLNLAFSCPQHRSSNDVYNAFSSAHPGRRSLNDTS